MTTGPPFFSFNIYAAPKCSLKYYLAMNMNNGLVFFGMPNFRDIGGYAASNGRRVGRKRVFRSERLFSLTDQDLEVFRETGIRSLFDLRSVGERSLHPNRLPEGYAVEEFHGNILTDVRSRHSAIFEPLRQDPSVLGARTMMRKIYSAMPEAFAPLFGSLVRSIGNGAAPLLIHCTAGKDRTGFAVAVLLTILGVGKDDIYEDYLKTGKCEVGADRVKDIGDLIESQIRCVPSEDIVDAITGVDTEYLDVAFEEISLKYGSVQNYMNIACKIDDESIEKLTSAMLE